MSRADSRAHPAAPDVPALRDLRVFGRRSGEVLAACVIGALVGTGWTALIGLADWETPSFLPRTVLTLAAAVLIALTAWMVLRSRPPGDKALWAGGVVIPSSLAATHLAFVLHGTPHYLFGLGGDQLNRVPYVGRFADSAALDDVFYADAAPFYPPGWFWIGGRLSALFGIEAWEFYKPFSIASMAAAAAIAFVCWRWIVGPRLALVVAMVTAIVGVHLNAYEPYSWIFVAVLPVVSYGVARLADPVARGDQRRPLVVAIGVYLGLAALTYTLIAGFAAAVTGGLMLLAAWRRRADRSAATAILRDLVTIAALSAALALLFWWRFLGAVLGGAETESSVANDFAPEISARAPLPMFEVSVSGLLCLIGLVWIVVRLVGGSSTTDRAVRLEHAVARALAALVVAVLAWYALSAVRALTGSTLLPFRMIPVITLALSVAGVFGALALYRWVRGSLGAERWPAARWVAIVLAVLASLQMAQHVSDEDSSFAEVARSTDGPPERLLAALDAVVPRENASEAVLLTQHPPILAYRPYFSYQAPAQAYASPAGRYETRLSEIERWATASSPAELAEMLDSGPVRGPDVFLLDVGSRAKESDKIDPSAPIEASDRGESAESSRSQADDEAEKTYVFTLIHNTMPRSDNNRRERLHFDPELFDDPDLFEVRELGNRVVIDRR